MRYVSLAFPLSLSPSLPPSLPPSWSETVERISHMVLTKEGEQTIEARLPCLPSLPPFLLQSARLILTPLPPSLPPSLLQSLQKSLCLRCQRLTTLMPGQSKSQDSHPSLPPSLPLSLPQSLQKFQCLRCQRLTTLMPGQLEDEIFTPDYKCPQCKSTRDMVVRKS